MPEVYRKLFWKKTYVFIMIIFSLLLLLHIDIVCIFYYYRKFLCYDIVLIPYNSNHSVRAKAWDCLDIDILGTFVCDKFRL